MSTSEFELTYDTWTEILTGPVSIPARIEASFKTSRLWEGASGSPPVATKLGHKLPEDKSDLMTLESGEAVFARASEPDGQTIITVTS